VIDMLRSSGSRESRTFSLCRSVGAPLCAALALASLVGCGGKPDPAPTVGLAQVIRGTLTLSRAGHTARVRAPARVEDGATVAAAADGRGSVTMDSGAWVLFDRGAEAKLALAKLVLTKGRVWVDARSADETTIDTGHGTLTAEGATFAVSLTAQGAEIYCASGEVTYRARGGEGRIAQGETAKLPTTGAPVVAGEALWDDWTGGLADPTPRSQATASAIGVLAGRRLDELGVARTPLAVRGHEVKVAVTGDLATTQIEQTFFNARSEVLEAEYRVRMPRGASVASFAVDTGGGFVEAQVSSLATQQGYELMWADPSMTLSSLSYDGPDRLRARVYPVAAGASVRIRLRYTEWLDRHGDTRTYVYPMASDGEPQLIGEFVLEVDTRSAEAGAYRAGMGARVEGGKVVLRRSDFKPRADFYLDLVDVKAPKAGLAPAYVVNVGRSERGGAEGDERYVLLDVPAEDDAEEPADAPLSLVLLVDVSGGTEPESLELARSIVEAVTRQLAPTDEIALRLADVTAHAPGGVPPGLAPASSETAEAILGALGRVELGGATDLSRALRDAASLVAGKPRGAVLYLGDGVPTTGAVDMTSVRSALASIENPPRFFALGVGDGANVDLLRGLFGGQASPVRERTEASRAVMGVLAEAARPTLRGVSVDLGPTVERVYPRAPIVVEQGAHLRLVGRLRGDLPATIVLHGVRDGRPVERTLKVESRSLADGGDVRRRWASARLAELLDEDAGREALVELGVRFGIVTPWTSLVVGGVPGGTFTPVRGFDRDPVEIAYDLGGGGTTIDAADVGGGSGWRRRSRRMEREPAALPEATWIPRVSTVAEIAAPAPRGGGAGRAPAGDGGLAQASVKRTLELGGRGPQACFERRLVVRPDLSGYLGVGIEVDGAGRVAKLDVASDSLGDSEVSACVLTEVRGLRFPVTGSPGVVSVTHVFNFAMPTRAIGTRRRCSDASNQDLEVRTSLWRERLTANQGVEGALGVWREALSNCELKTWRDRRTLIDKMVEHVGPVGQQVRLYQALRGDGAVAMYLRRAILRNVRTPWDVDAVREGLGLEVPVDWSFFSRLFRSLATPALKLALVRRWLEVAPDEMDLRLRLLSLLEETNALPEAKRLARELRADPLADARVRTAVGEFWLRRNDEKEARRVFSEIVELAPLDPWARQRLGDLYRAHGWADDAYREYQMLARLKPNDGAVMLLMARAAADAGRLDEALRLEQRLAESVDPGVETGAAGFARLWTLVRLARLRAGTQDAALIAQVRERERGAGAFRDPPALFAALTWDHPDDRPALFARFPSTPPEIGWERASASGPEFGIEAVRVREREDGDYLFEVRREDRDALRDTEGELLVVVAPGTPEQRIAKVSVSLSRETRVRRYRLALDGTLVEVPVTPDRPAAAAPPPPR
jgi:tetratricopeptide (TPR) repeat protein